MQQQLPQFLVLHRWLPDGRKTLLHQQSQNVPGIPLVGLLLAWSRSANRARVPKQKFMTQFVISLRNQRKLPVASRPMRT